MIAIAVIALVAVSVLVLVGLIASPNDRADQIRDLRDLDRSVGLAYRQLDSEYQAARRAMNTAAGQSWRNLVD